MTKEEQIRNWLIAGMQQPVDRISEIFYFDRRDNEFFSILITDYFLFDENYNITKGATSNYSEKSLKMLIDKMKKIEVKDPEIVELPRLEKHENANDVEYISQKMNHFLNINDIDIENTTIWDIEESPKITFDLKDHDYLI